MKAMLRHPTRFMRDLRFTRAHASEYLDGELDDPARRRIDRHTGVCPPCRDFVESLRRLVEGLTGLRAQPGGDVSESVIRRLRDEA